MRFAGPNSMRCCLTFPKKFEVCPVVFDFDFRLLSNGLSIEITRPNSISGERMMMIGCSSNSWEKILEKVQQQHSMR